jgi:outer membrane lipoprotein-sorting protein
MTKKIFKILLPLMILSLMPICSFAITDAEGKAILKKSDENTTYKDSDFKADYVMVQDKPGQGKSETKATMYRRDSKLMYTIRITSPESDKGKGYVQFDESIWFYDPHDKQFTFTSAKNKFQNTNLNNSDLSPQNFSRDYTISKMTEVTLGKFNCILFELKAAVKNVDYPTVKLWIGKEDCVVRKREDYSLSGQLLRTTAIPSYQNVEGHLVPAGMVIIDNLRGSKINGKMQYEKTQITISNVSFQKQKDVVYSKQYLETMSD